MTEHYSFLENGSNLQHGTEDVVWISIELEETEKESEEQEFEPVLKETQPIVILPEEAQHQGHTQLHLQLTVEVKGAKSCFLKPCEWEEREVIE